jgi:hypothetical protein
LGATLIHDTKWAGVSLSATPQVLANQAGNHTLVSPKKLAAPRAREGAANGVILNAQGLIPQVQLAERGQGRACRGFFPVERKTRYLNEGEKQHGSSDFRSGMEG